MIILKKIFLLIWLAVFADLLSADNSGLNNLISTNYIIESKVFDENRKLQVYLPKGYQSSSKKYPVMYIMDGDWYFLHGVGYQKSLDYIDRTPDYIVVGISTDSDLSKRQRFFRTKDFELKTDKLTSYLEKEVIPFVESQFRTSAERLYFGWEIAGTLGLDIFINKPELFDGYILASPTGIHQEQLDAVEKSLPKSEVKFLYFTMSPVEKWALSGTKKLAELLKTKAQNGLKWKYDLLENEDHYSTPIPSIYNGLKTFFSDYAPLRFYSLQEFNDFGGLKELEVHYNKRGVRYGISTDIHPDTKHHLLMLTSMEEDIDSFERFFNQFKGHFETYKWYDADFYTLEHGENSLSNNKPDLAIAVFNTGIDRFPDSPKLHNGLGDAYLLKKSFKQAGKFYQKAIELAKKASDPELTKYEDALKNMNK